MEITGKCFQGAGLCAVFCTALQTGTHAASPFADRYNVLTIYSHQIGARGTIKRTWGTTLEQAFISDAGYAVRRVCAVMVRISFSMLVHCTEFSFRK